MNYKFKGGIFLRKIEFKSDTPAIESLSNNMFNKVPVITLFFWIIKILATTVGETSADFLSDTLNFGLMITSVIMSVLLLIVLIFQVKANKYIPGLYWLSVVLISIVGTLVSDSLVDNLGISLITTTIIFSFALILIFILWFSSEKTLSVHSINTTKREIFYWLAILFTFALGTSAGDLIAEGLNLGYLLSAMLFLALICIVYFAYSVLKINNVLVFWIAYILTRPLGASFGDLLSQSRHNGGIGLGTVGTSAIFLSVIFSIVYYLTKTKKDIIPNKDSLEEFQ